ncbi:hypothetical protein D3C87_1479730 [compost metagenome]
MAEGVEILFKRYGLQPALFVDAKRGRKKNGGDTGNVYRLIIEPLGVAVSENFGEREKCFVLGKLRFSVIGGARLP